MLQVVIYIYIILSECTFSDFVSVGHKYYIYCQNVHFQSISWSYIYIIFCLNVHFSDSASWSYILSECTFFRLRISWSYIYCQNVHFQTL